jgi:hypothetical protein
MPVILATRFLFVFVFGPELARQELYHLTHTSNNPSYSEAEIMRIAV